MEQEQKENTQEPIPFWQTIIDDTSMLILIGLVVPTILYTIWGIMELVSVPIFSR
jgi:hypothetical protein